MSLAVKLRTLAALGPRSLLRVGRYRLGVRSGLHAVRRLPEPARAAGPFFAARGREGQWPAADARWHDSVVRFDWMIEPLPPSGVPDWLANPLGRAGTEAAAQPWWTISDFGAGDIKGLWELSRFGWVLALAQAAVRGEPGADARLNQWIAAWVEANPPYRGPNWKCGQEASIRVMHLLAAAMLLDEDRAPAAGLVTLIAQHLARIAPTISYALGQDNNHGTSEAAALFIGGSFLRAAGDPRGAAWERAGRRWLEERAAALIEPDGSFSQYSVTYHRVMLDTYALAECWRQRGGLAAFSPRLAARLAAATEWLRAMVDAGSGDAPNIGASDGARLLPLTDTGYRDFRPSVQLASALFRGVRAYPAGPWDAQLQWLGVTLPGEQAPPLESRSFDDGGWHVLRCGDALAVLRYPRFRFRPSQADALHLDLTVRGVNLLRDAGTYSYNDPSVPDGDFTATRFHNTVTFDDRDQMPRLGRFLFGDWLRADSVEAIAARGGELTAGAAYRDGRGNRHARTVVLAADRVTCRDALDGGFARATLRWRLPPGDWRLADNRLTGRGLEIEVTASGAEPVLTLSSDREARDYARISAVALLEVSVDRPCHIATQMRF